MTHTKQLLLSSFFYTVSALSDAQAATVPLFDAALNSQTIYSGAAITTGAGSTTAGSLQAVAGVTLGANAKVGGDLIAGAAITLGADAKVGGNAKARDGATIGADVTIGGDLNVGDAASLGATTKAGYIMVGGDLTAGAAVIVGVKSAIAGNLTAGANSSATLGASATVGGNTEAGIAILLGADVLIGANATAGTGGIALGQRSVVIGNATAGTTVTVPLDASVDGKVTEGLITIFPTIPKEAIDNQKVQLSQLKATLASIEAPLANELATTMTANTTLKAGVYHTTALSTTAGITLTLDGKGKDDFWIFNIDTFAVFGANMLLDLIDVTDNSTLIWNIGGYTTTGANTDLFGVILSGSYITTGASTKLAGIGNACGGIFTVTGAITIGATNTIGNDGCVVAAISHNFIIDERGIPAILAVELNPPVPLPAAFWLFGSGLLGFAALARLKKRNHHV
jgi:MSHA biogenesis protein MshQ